MEDIPTSIAWQVSRMKALAAVRARAADLVFSTYPSAVGCTKRKRTSPIRRRYRRQFQHLLSEMSEQHFRLMYRMTKHSFFELLQLIKPYMKISQKPSSGAINRTPNGLIQPEVRLGATLRYFAGAYDIAALHGISVSAFWERCVWIVLDAIHKCPALDITYPVSHDEQLEIARGFEEKSDVGFTICA
jgi:hypothetical protein